MTEMVERVAKAIFEKDQDMLIRLTHTATTSRSDT